jgi:hypothetical protein
MGLWSVAASSFADEVERRAAAWGLPICLIKGTILCFLFYEDGDIPRLVLLHLAEVVTSGRLQ